MINFTAHTSPATLETTRRNQAPNCNPQGDGIAARVLHDAWDAKEKLVNANVEEETVMAIMAIGNKKLELMSALVDFVCTDDTTKAIANRHSFHPSVLTYWSRVVGLPKRRRGRRALLQPTSLHTWILELVRDHGITGAARRAGVSKQRVSQIVCRWAPELKGRRQARTIVVLPGSKRRSPREDRLL